MKGFLKVALTTAILTVAFAGSALAYGPDRGGKNYQSNVTGTTSTGYGTFTEPNADLVKNVSGQKTHTDFKSNTNSCASCHMTHTANADSLLFGTSTQATCIACHDGSLGFYNVKTGELYKENATNVTINGAYTDITTAKVVGSNAGSFDRSKSDSSMHDVDGGKALSSKAAPGGNYAGKTGETGKWEDAFTCASCHAPHGSYSDRLLHYNPNGFASVDVKDRGFGLTRNPLVSTNERLGYNVINVADVQTVKADLYKVVKGTKEDHIATGTTFLGKSIADHLANVPTGETVVAVYQAVKDYSGVIQSYKLDTTPWIYAPGASYPYPFSNDIMYKAGVDIPSMDIDPKPLETGPGKDKDGVLSAAEAGALAITKKTTGVNYNYGKGYAYGAPLADAVFARISRASIVDLDLVEVARYTPKDLPLYVVNNGALVGGKPDANGTIDPAQTFASGKYTKTVGMGQKFSKFCATCHVDYLANSSNAEGVAVSTGHYNNFSYASCNDCHQGTSTTVTANAGNKFRHTTTNDSFSCARCHLSHGSNSSVMKDAEGNDIASLIGKQIPGQAPGVVYDVTTATSHIDDVNASSAIKRYTNMAVCWSCHTDNAAESLVNNKYYQNAKFTAVTETGNKSWSEGNRIGFAKTWTKNGIVSGIAYKDLTFTGSWKSSTEGYTGVDYATNTFFTKGKVNAKLGGIKLNFLSFGMLSKAAQNVGTVKIFEGTTEVGTLTVDPKFRTVSALFTALVTSDGNPSTVEKAYTFTLDGVVYNIAIK